MEKEVWAKVYLPGYSFLKSDLETFITHFSHLAQSVGDPTVGLRG